MGTWIGILIDLHRQPAPETPRWCSTRTEVFCSPVGMIRPWTLKMIRCSSTIGMGCGPVKDGISMNVIEYLVKDGSNWLFDLGILGAFHGNKPSGWWFTIALPSGKGLMGQVLPSCQLPELLRLGRPGGCWGICSSSVQPPNQGRAKSSRQLGFAVDIKSGNSMIKQKELFFLVAGTGGSTFYLPCLFGLIKQWSFRAIITC